MRLNQFIARHSELSRRAADAAIANGRVSVNHNLAKLGQTVEIGDKVTLDSKIINWQKLVYLALNKPVGYISSRRVQGNTPILYSLLPTEYQNLKSVGRLDKDSSGLIILTNDGIFAQTLTHPKYSKTKRYQVVLNKPLLPSDSDRLRVGIELEDGPSRMKTTGRGRSIEVSLTEGRNRQIRRTFAALGYQVTELKRTHFGRLSLDGLMPGQYRLIDPNHLI